METIALFISLIVIISLLLVARHHIRKVNSTMENLSVAPMYTTWQLETLSNSRCPVCGIRESTQLFEGTINGINMEGAGARKCIICSDVKIPSGFMHELKALSSISKARKFITVTALTKVLTEDADDPGCSYEKIANLVAIINRRGDADVEKYIDNLTDKIKSYPGYSIEERAIKVIKDEIATLEYIGS